VSLSAPPEPWVDRFESDVFRPHRVERRRQQRLRRRRNRRRGLVAGILAVALLGAYLLLARGDVPAPPPPPTAAPAATVTDPTAAWSVRVGTHLFVVVFAAPAGRHPTALAIPEDTAVDVPDGPDQMGGADLSVEMLIAATQATLERRVAHAVTSQQSDLSTLIDDLGGVTVELDAVTNVGDAELGPGGVRLLGAEAVAYLNSATPEDRSLRWETLLQGLMGAAPDRAAWAALAGPAHPGAASVFEASLGADVFELPTVVSDLGTSSDTGGVADLVASRFPLGGQLVKVIVLTGVSRPGVVRDVIGHIAPAGYWVVASQTASERRVGATEIVAGDEGFLEDANTVRDVLGVGRVYVGTQPTGVADVTIVVGEDYIGG
jgi:hypothetical protein